MQWWKKVVLQNYANFKGRARRKEFWMFILFHVIFLIIAGILDNLLGLNFKTQRAGFSTGPIYLIYALAVLIPCLAVWARRLHDTGKSCWWLLIALVPIIGAIVLLIFAIFDSTPGENKYGPNPKGVSA